EIAAMLWIRDVSGHQHAPASAGLDQALRLARVLLLIREIADQHVRALARERERDGAANARVAAGDDGPLVLQSRAAAIALFAGVRRGIHLAARARQRLRLRRERRLRKLSRLAHGASSW